MVIEHTEEPATTDRTGHRVVFDAMTSADTVAIGDGSGVASCVVGTGVGTPGLVAGLGAEAVGGDEVGLTEQEAAMSAAIGTAISNDIG